MQKENNGRKAALQLSSKADAVFFQCARQGFFFSLKRAAIVAESETHLS